MRVALGPPPSAPTLAEELVPRPELVDRLSGSTQARLAVIVAPPGYGKSTLLHDWASRDDRRFIWLSGSEASAESLLTEFHEACALHARFVLVLDDADAVADPGLRAAAEVVCTRMPSESLLAVASRTEPDLPIGTMRAHRTLVELRTGDLAMSPAEAASLLRRAGVELEFEAVRGLARATEGWPAALYLAALSLREGTDDGPVSFAGDDHRVAEFLRDDVLRSVPKEQLDFVLRTSVLAELSGPLCDHVLERHGSAPLLAALARSNQLLLPVDSAHTRFRWQRLFRDALIAELRRSRPELEPEIHRRASGWYQQRDDTDRAIDHAAASGDVEQTAELLWASVHSYLEHGRQAKIDAWLSAFSHDLIAADPKLAMCAAHSALATGNVGAAEQWARSAAAALQRGAGTTDRTALARRAGVIESVATRNGVLPMYNELIRAYRRERPESPWRPALCMLAGTAEYLLGDREAAARLLDEGAEFDDSTAPVSTALCRSVGVMLALEREDWSVAEELADRARQTVDDRGICANPTCALVFAAAAAARAHQGRADEAKRDLQAGLNLLVALGEFLPWYGAVARILLAYASLWLADIVGARSLLAEASRLARQTSGAVVFQHWFDDAWSYVDTIAETTMTGPSSLTIAELRVLRFLPSHRSFREIATQLGVSVNTVKTQAHAVYRKLDAASRSEAVARASQAGLLGH